MARTLSDENVHVVATLPAHYARGLDVPANAHVETFVPTGRCSNGGYAR